MKLLSYHFNNPSTLYVSTHIYNKIIKLQNLLWLHHIFKLMNVHRAIMDLKRDIDFTILTSKIQK